MAEGKFDVPNQEYWQVRAKELEDKVFKDTLEIEKELDRIYREHIAEIVTKIDSFFHKYATDNKITLQEAEQLLTGIDLVDYQARLGRLLREYQATQNPFVLRDIQNLIMQGQISRLDGLLNELIIETGMLAENAQITMEEFLEGVYEEAYYQTIFSVDKALGVGVAFAHVNKEAVETILQYRWSGDMFSSRIWKNKTRLVEVLKEELIRGMVQGTSIQTMSKNLKDKLNSSTYNAKRIVRTEANFVLNQACSDGYQEVGVERYQIIATLDSRTSQICQRQDLKVYELSEKRIGVNHPPFHPNCRSTISAYLNKIDANVMRRARGEDGRTYLVPADMSYEQWKEMHNI